MVTLQSAYASCQRDARRHYENFPVASLLIPAAMRPHIAAVYAFARAADDFADEGVRAVGERERLLEGWGRRLGAAAVSLAPGPPPAAGEPSNAVEIFVALGATIRACRLPLALFDDLLSAFRQDIHVTRYETWDDLLDYCRRSANPVGRLVLGIAGCRDPQLEAWSDAICTALQLTNFWQDAAIDAARGRIYLPASERRRCGATEDMLAGGTMTAEWQRALGAAAVRTRALFMEGRPLCDAIRGRLRYELRATWLGGTRILARLEAAGFDVFERRPALGVRDLPWLVWHLVTWREPCGMPVRGAPRGVPRAADGGRS